MGRGVTDRRTQPPGLRGEAGKIREDETPERNRGEMVLQNQRWHRSEAPQWRERLIKPL